MENQKQMKKNVNVASFKMQMFAMWSFLLVAIIIFSILYFWSYKYSEDINIENIAIEIKDTLSDCIKSDICFVNKIKNSTKENSSDDIISHSNITDYDSDIIIVYKNNYLYLSKEEFTNFCIENSDNLNNIDIIKSSISLEVSENEIELMARSIYCETLDGTFEDSLSVAATMVNTYMSKNDVTMYDLISGNQFANPDYGEIEEYNFYNADISEDHQYYQAAVIALAGADPTGGCKAFYMPSDPIDQDCWHESLEYRYTSPNGHRFFYYD